MTDPADEFSGRREPLVSPSGGQPDDDDWWRWQEVSRLNGQHPRWVVIWHRETSEFRAYGRLPGARRDTALSARTPGRLSDLIRQTEEAAASR